MSSPHSWNSFSRPHFPIFKDEYIIFPQYLPSYINSLHHPPSHWCQPPDLFYLPVLCFEKRRFCLFKIAIQGVSLWHFYVYMYYKSNWFISLFFLSTFSPFLIVISTGFKILHSFLYRKYIHIHLVNFFLLSSLSR
jgi:hypothetical protein